MSIMLNIYRLHSKDCKHRAKGRGYRNCQCRIWVQGTIGGVPIRQSLGEVDWKTAQDKMHEMQLAGKVQKKAAIKAACDEFIADMESRHLAGPTIKKYRALLTSTACSSLVEYCKAHEVKTIREIDVAFLTTWRGSWPDAGITQSKKLERLRGFWRWCVERDYADKPVAAAVKPPKVRHCPTLPFTPDEVARLLAGAVEQGHPEEGRRLRAFILICRYTGLRRGDVAKLACSALQGQRLLLRQEKTGEPLYTLLPQDVVDELRHTPRVSDRFWFWTGTSAPGTVGGNFGRAFLTLCRKIGIENGHLHRLRDTFAVEALNAGVPIEVVSRLLGHGSIRVTEKHYSPWVKSRQVQADEAMAAMWAREIRNVGVNQERVQ